MELKIVGITSTGTIYSFTLISYSEVGKWEVDFKEE